MTRQRLKHAWVPFFGAFNRLTAVQEAAIPMILDDKSVIVASPTASGKTEAIVAPEAEHMVVRRADGLNLLYLVPTRALANDTLVRIEAPLRAMHLSAAHKHGDQPALPKQVPNVLVTTPESLDSLLCRREPIFRTLQSVAIDEVHLVDNTYRGDQVRVLLNRLARVAEAPDRRVHLMSATVADPLSVAARYSPTAHLVAIPGGRAIDFSFAASADEVYAQAIKENLRKLLWFCNRRESVEKTASELSALWRSYPVVAHHGSLGRRQRSDAEKVMREAPIAVCVATSTLEVGVDIGDIDLVVLGDPPWSLSAMRQRLGRGNRRQGRIRATAIAASEVEREHLASMFEAAGGSELEEVEYSSDLSVVVQQTLSCLYQHPDGLSGDDVDSIVAPLCKAEQAVQIREHLAELGWTSYHRGRWYPQTKLMDLGERGSIHSNIPDEAEVQVIDADHRTEVGRISEDHDETFVLARHSWQVVSRDGDRIFVRRTERKGDPARFRARKRRGRWWSLLPKSLRNDGL